MENDLKSLNTNKQNDMELNKKKIFPSQHYVDLFYSQLAFSYYSSLYFHWLNYSNNVIQVHDFQYINNSSLFKYSDPFPYLNKKKVNNFFNIHSDMNQDFGSQIQLTNSIVYRNESCQVLLSQFYDYNIKVCDKSEITTEFSLIGGYESNNKNFSYFNEKKYSINPWERYHISILMKAIFIFMFFDVSKELYIILISLYFLYIKGFFDIIQDIFERISSNHPIEATLADLRRRRAEIEQEMQQKEQEMQQKEQELINNKENHNLEDLIDSNQFNEDTNFNEFQDGSSILSINEDDFVDTISIFDKEESQDLLDETNQKENQIIKYYTCVFYQTIGMYVLTLMPWWNPDPTYLV